MPENPFNPLSAVQQSLPPGSFQLLHAIAELASGINMPLYLVGGSVRDVLLGRPVKDLDLVVEGDAAVLAFEVSKELGGDVTDYSQFGTATFNLQGQRFDLATARQETYLKPGSLPSVNPSTIHEDLGRRDFSINAMAIALSGPHPAGLLDPHAGTKDLELGVIRVLHARSFMDDATRILRAIRYEQRLNFHLADETHALMLEALGAGAMDTVSGDRVRRELELMFKEDEAWTHISRCGELGVLKAIYPALGNGSGVKTLGGRTVAKTPLAYLAALSYPCTAQEAEALVRRLRMPVNWARVVRDTVALRLKSGGDPTMRPHIGDPGLSPAELCTILDEFSSTSVEVTAALTESPRVKTALELYLNHLRYVKTSLTGNDVISLGAVRGPQVGQILRELRVAKIEGRVNGRDEEIQLARDHIVMQGG